MMSERPRHGQRHRARAAALLAFLCSALLGLGCASRPRPTAESLRRAANASAIVEGHVLDAEGRPVAGISVQGLPREKHLGWSHPTVTDGEGKFRLSLVAPGAYGFLLARNGISVVTPRADDPARILVSLAPGEHRAGIELVFRSEAWDGALRAPAAPRAP